MPGEFIVAIRDAVAFGRTLLLFNVRQINMIQLVSLKAF
jgi:hypothetical protein